MYEGIWNSSKRVAVERMISIGSIDDKSKCTSAEDDKVASKYNGLTVELVSQWIPTVPRS